MFELSYYALNALLVCIAIAVLWVALKTVFSFIGFSYKAVSLPFIASKKTNQHERVVFVTSVKPNKKHNAAHKQKTSDTAKETVLLTQFADKKNWSSYDVPTYLRKNIPLH